MANTIQIKRKSGTGGTLADGEFGLDTASNTLYIGNNSTNIPIGRNLQNFNLKGFDLILGTSSSSSNDSSDIQWQYGNGQEKARIWTGNDLTSKTALYFREYKSDGTQLYNGYLVLGDGTGASGTWGINISGNAAKDGSGNTITSTYLKLAGGTLSAGAQIIRAGKSSSWYNGRDYAIFRANSISGYSAFLSLKTTNGSWEIGSYDASGAYDKLAFNYTPDSSYSSSTNTGTVRVYLNSNGVLEGTATRATGDGDGNTISSTYLKLSGGSLSGWVWHSAEVGDIYDTERYVSGGGGWSYTPIRFRSAPLGSYFFTIGAYGADNALTYAFIGPSTSYSSSSNMRIYPSGAVYMGNGGLQIGDGANTSEISCKVSGKAGLIYMYSASSTTGNRGIYLSTGAGTRAAKYVMYNDSNNENHFYGLIDQIYYGSSAPTARTGQVWLKPI